MGEFNNAIISEDWNEYMLPIKTHACLLVHTEYNLKMSPLEFWGDDAIPQPANFEQFIGPNNLLPNLITRTHPGLN